MENFKKYLSTAPVLLTLWMSFTAGFIIEANRFYPDALTFPTLLLILIKVLVLYTLQYRSCYIILSTKYYYYFLHKFRRNYNVILIIFRIEKIPV
uniref:photosystem I subunit IX n=1 Tax=Fibrocapsa japonica TaxID=94617 RepID=UPI0021159374|nr:photosystem I subunit IX [Fibrocapsa japonica]UTE95094.1 photosystem I subunit IX [Fibrocapsa japonica]